MSKVSFSSYCVKCRAKTESKNLQPKMAKNGRPMIQSQCGRCGGKKSMFVSKAMMNGGSIGSFFKKMGNVFKKGAEVVKDGFEKGADGVKTGFQKALEIGRDQVMNENLLSKAVGAVLPFGIGTIASQAIKKTTGMGRGPARKQNGGIVASQDQIDWGHRRGEAMRQFEAQYDAKNPRANRWGF